jgi:hypothetical protein
VDVNYNHRLPKSFERAPLLHRARQLTTKRRRDSNIQIKGRHNNNTNNTNNNNKAKCIPGGTLRVLAGKNQGLSKARIVGFGRVFCLQGCLVERPKKISKIFFNYF